MKKSFFSLLGALFLLAPSAYAEWIFLDRVEETSVENIEFINFTLPEFDDYILVIDGLAPQNESYNILLQLGVNDGVNPIQWITSNAGGISSLRAGATTIVSTPATYQGIPVTNVANEGTSFTGEIRVHNTGIVGSSLSASYGPLCIYGVGLLGFDGTGFISGTFNNAGPINCLRFVSANPSPTAISTVSITLYGLKQTGP